MKRKTVIYPVNYRHRYLKVKPMPTLIIALKCRDGVVMASDGRIVILDEYHQARKIFKISRNLVVGAAGSIGAIHENIESLNGVSGSLNNCSDRNIIAERINQVYARNMRMYGELLGREAFMERFGGDMLICDGSDIYRFLTDGFPEPSDPYECIGSARPYGQSILRDLYEENLDMERAKELAVYVILQTIRISRDVGEPIQIAEIPKNSEAKVFEDSEVRDVVERINGRQKTLSKVWELLSKHPDFKEKLQKLIESQAT